MKKILYKLLNHLIKPKLANRKDGAEREFMLRLSVDIGWKSYLTVRDLFLLKELGKGLSERDYWITLGQRKELLILEAKAQEYRRLKDGEDKEPKYK